MKMPCRRRRTSARSRQERESEFANTAAVVHGARPARSGDGERQEERLHADQRRDGVLPNPAATVFGLLREATPAPMPASASSAQMTAATGVKSRTRPTCRARGKRIDVPARDRECSSTSSECSTAFTTRLRRLRASTRPAARPRHDESCARCSLRIKFGMMSKSTRRTRARTPSRSPAARLRPSICSTGALGRREHQDIGRCGVLEDEVLLAGDAGPTGQLPALGGDALRARLHVASALGISRTWKLSSSGLRTSSSIFVPRRVGATRGSVISDRRRTGGLREPTGDFRDEDRPRPGVAR